MSKSHSIPSLFLMKFQKRLSALAMGAFSVIGLGLSVTTFAGEFSITAPDKCENGAVCPVNIDMSPPLGKGDTFVVTINGQEATTVRVVEGDLAHFGARFITPVGLSKLVVTCLQCDHQSTEKTIQTGISRPLSSSNSSPKSIRVRARGGEFRVLVEAEDTVSGYAFFDTSTSRVLIKQTPFTVKNPYYAIKGSFSDGNHCFAFQTGGLLVQCTAGSRSLSIPPTELASLSQQLIGGYISSAPPQNSVPVPEVQVSLPQSDLRQPVSTPQAISTTGRLALIIGNNTYKNVPRLQNAIGDSKAVAGLLASLGYEVQSLSDLNEKQFKAALRNFKQRLRGGEEVVFFFAGHGVQIGSANYLLPTDVGSDSEDQIQDEGSPLQRVLDDFSESKVKFSLAMVDACRDNPFKSTGRSIGGRGLTATTAATGQMVIFSAGVGQQALDRLGTNDKARNGLFTRVLIDKVSQSKEPIHILMRDVRAEVAKLAQSVGHEQVPAIYDQVIGDFYFVDKK